MRKLINKELIEEIWDVFLEFDLKMESYMGKNTEPVAAQLTIAYFQTEEPNSPEKFKLLMDIIERVNKDKPKSKTG